MADTYFDPGDQRAAKVCALFGKIAARYDLLNDLQSFGLHRVWKRQLVRLADVRPGRLALDVCCGTGDIALALARRGATVTGLDFSEPMLEIARRKSKVQTPESATRSTHPLSRIQHPASTAPSVCFLRGDALHLPFPDNSFDIVTIGYGLRNLADLEAGLCEMRRVAKPGGRLFVLDFGKPDNALWRGIYFGYLRLFVPLLGRVFCGSADAYAYILESLRAYPAQQGVAARMRELGLLDVRIRNQLGGIMSINSGQKPV